jgi:hypothetical protein
MSNTFVTPRVVTTIAQSRIDYNNSITSLLQNFASAGEPDPAEISLEGTTGLNTGMFWYKAGTTTSDGQGRFLVYDGSSFTRNGIGTYQMASAAEANNAATAGTIEYGDIILLGTDELYIVNAAETGVVPISRDALTLSGLVSTQFLRSDIETTAEANVYFNSNNFIKVPTGSTAQRPEPGKTVSGQIRFNEDLDQFEGRHLSSWSSLSPTIPAANTDNMTANIVFTTTGVGSRYINENLTFNPSTGAVSATIFNSTSDERLKENIEPISDAVHKIETLQGYIFNFKNQKDKSAGLLAQQVKEVLPEAVYEDDKGKLSLNYSAVIALIVQAFNEYKNTTDTKIANLESRLNGR